MMKMIRPYLALALVAAAATADEASPSVFTDTTEVRVVNVDVTVTDRQGVPILGLGPGDFVVLEDGVPVEITNFAFVDERTSDRSAGQTVAAADATEPTAAEPPRGLDLFVYVDNFNLIPAKRDLALDDLVDHLRRTRGTNDRVTLIVHNGGRPQFLLRQSTDMDEIAAAVDQIREMPGGGMDDRLLTRGTVRAIQDVFDRYSPAFQRTGSGRPTAGGTACGEAAPELRAVARSHAEIEASNVAQSVRGLATATRVIGAVDGRKSVLYVSHGFQTQPGLAIFRLLADLCTDGSYETEALEFNETNRLDELASSANTNRVTFYPLQTSGLGTSPLASAAAFDRRFLGSSVTDMAARQNLQGTLTAIAIDTGGEAIFNTNDFTDALTRVDARLRAYYSIGYRPPGEADGRRHEIEVELARPIAGARVSSRRSYEAKTRDDRLIERVEAALEGFSDNPLGVRLDVAPTPAENGPGAALRFTLDRTLLTYVPGADGWSCELDFVLTHATSEGSSTRSRRITLRANDEGDRAPSGVEVIEIGVPAAPGLNRYALGIVDVVSGLASTLASDLESPGS